MSSLALALAPPAKSVVLYRNGDPFFPGRRFVLNQRHFQTWEVFLKEVTKSIQAPLAVRNLYTPRHGHRLARLGDLQDGCHYVAAGSERFKKLDYLSHGRKEQCGRRKREALQLQAAAPWHTQMGWQKDAHSPCTIHVFRNGDLLSPPLPLPLSKSSPLQWDTLLAMLTQKVNLRCGAVHRLCRLDGTQVSSGEELLHGHYYVAVGDEEYKKLPYFQLLVPQGSMSSTLWTQANSRQKQQHRRLDGHSMQSRGAAGKAEIPAASPQVQRQARRSHFKEEFLFHTKPVRAGQNRRSSRNVQCWLEQEGSVYKPRDSRKEMQGAQEVKEDQHTRLDVPTLSSEN